MLSILMFFNFFFQFTNRSLFFFNLFFRIL